MFELFIAGIILFSAAAVVFLWLGRQMRDYEGQEGIGFLFNFLGLLCILGGFNLMVNAGNIQVLTNWQELANSTTVITTHNETASYAFTNSSGNIFSGFFVGSLWAIMFAIFITLSLLIIRFVMTFGGFVNGKPPSRKSLYNKGGD